MKSDDWIGVVILGSAVSMLALVVLAIYAQTTNMPQCPETKLGMCTTK